MMDERAWLVLFCCLCLVVSGAGLWSAAAVILRQRRQRRRLERLRGL